MRNLRGSRRRARDCKYEYQKRSKEDSDVTSARAKADWAQRGLMYRVRTAKIESKKAVVPTLLSGNRVSIHRLSVLPRKKEPAHCAANSRKRIHFTSAGPEVDVGLPSELLKRRPEIRRARRKTGRREQPGSVRQKRIYSSLVLTGRPGRQALNS